MKWYALYRDGELISVMKWYGEPTPSQFPCGAGLAGSTYEVIEEKGGGFLDFPKTKDVK